VAQSDLKISITGDSASAEGAFSRTREASAGLSTALQAVGGALAFDKITSAFSHILQASSQAELGTSRFIAAMKGAGMAVDPGAFQDFASGLQDITTFEDDTVIASGAMLGRFRLTQDQIQNILPSLADFSTAMGQDMVGASSALGRALLTGGEGLRSLGLGFTESEKKAFELGTTSQRLTIIQSKMTAQFGGAASAAAGTAAGAMQQLKNAFGEIEESMGRVIDAPVGNALRAMRDAAKAVNDRFDSLSDGTKNLLGALAGGITTTAAVATGIAALGGALSLMSNIASGAASAMRALGVAATGTWLRVAAPAAIAIGGAILLIGAMKQAWDGNLFGIRSTMISVAQTLQQVWAALVQTLSGLWQGFTEGVADKLTYIKALAASGSPIAASDAVATSRQTRAQAQSGPQTTGPSALDKAIFTAQAALQTAGEGAADALGNIKNTFAEGGKVIRDALEGLGLDLSSFDSHTAEKRPAPVASTGGKNASTRPGAESNMKVEGIASAMMKVNTELDPSYAENAISALKAAFASSSLTEDQYKKIADSTGGNVQKAMQIAGDFVELQSLTAAMRSNYEANPPAPPNVDLAGAAATFTDGFVSGLGNAGRTINNAIQAGMSGGPLAAIASVGVDLLQRSTAFQEISASLSGMMDSLAQALNPLLDAFDPVLEMVQQLLDGGVVDILKEAFGMIGDVLKSVFNALRPFIVAAMPALRAVGDLFRALSPIITALAQVLQPILMVGLPMFQIGMEILKVALDAVVWVLKIVSKAIIYTFKGIGWVWNGIIDAIAWVLEGIDTILPGDILKDFANTLRRGKMDMDALDGALKKLDGSGEDAADEQKKNTEELAKSNEELSNLPSLLKVTRARFDAALAEGPETDPVAQTLAAVNTNMQSMFGGRESANASTDMSRKVTIGTLNVGGSTGADTADALKRSLEADRFRLTGSTQASPYPYATPRTAGGV
jgi:phage-related protein